MLKGPSGDPRGRLYRATHATFEAYCRERWDMGRNYVNKLIGATEVTMYLGTMVPILPVSERQARPLTELRTEDEDGRTIIDLEEVANDPIGYVLSQNLHRRHLTVSQRAQVGDRARELYDKQAQERMSAGGGDKKSTKAREKSGPINCSDPIAKGDARDQAGAALGVSGRIRAPEASRGAFLDG